MRIAYLDCFSGISGDMFLGALVAAGVPIALLRETVAALDLDAQLDVSSVMRSGISSVKVDVIIHGEKDMPRETFAEQELHLHHTFVGGEAHGQDHEHAHNHEHPHEHQHPHEHEHAHAEAAPVKHVHGRSLRRIREIIAQAPISATAKATAIAIFETLGRAEAGIHNVPLEDIHFHEVGSTDAIVDITCAAVGAEALQVDQWVCSGINVGGGTVECAHGTFPVPAPATLEILRTKGAPVFSSGIEKELATPTGAAIVSVLAKSFGAFPPMAIEQIGYGAGYRDIPGHANVVRLTVGQADTSAATACLPGKEAAAVTVIEVNLDDISSQVVGYVIERVLAAGAFDVFTTPIQMKKSRPALLLTVLCRPEDTDRMASILFMETTTLGVRIRQEARQCLARRLVSVATPWGEVRMKLGSVGDKITNSAPEYEDCRRIAAEHNIPLKTVMQEAVRLYMERHHE
jgi:uncharacterized protein (TIGR00299 family) protein